MKGYGLSALAPSATAHPSPLSGGTGDRGVPGRGTKAITTANLQIELPKFDPKNLPESPTPPSICTASGTITSTNRNTGDGTLTHNQHPHCHCHQRHHHQSRHPQSAPATNDANTAP